MFILCVWVFVCTQSHGCQSGCVSPWIWSYGQLQAITSVLEIEPGFFARTTCVLNHQATSKLFFFSISFSTCSLIASNFCFY